MHRVLIVAATLALLLVAGASATASRVAVHLSDLHMDPFFGTDNAVGPCGAGTAWSGLPGCDSSPQMATAAINASVNALAAAHAALPADAAATPLLIYTGDWLRHKMDRLENPDVVGANIARQISAAFAAAVKAAGASVAGVFHPSIPASMGNEDFIPDYHFNVSAAGSVPLLKQFAAAMRESGLLVDAAQEATFGYCGYAAHRVDPGKLRVLALNTLLYSTKLQPGTTEADPCGQFAWMREQLDAAVAAGEQVHLLSHIPPSVLLWHGNFIDTYTAVLQNYTTTVAAQFYGHIHRFSYMAPDDDAIAPIFVGGPITRVSRTWPDFTLMPLGGAGAATVLDRLQRPFDETTGAFNGTGLSLKAVLGLDNVTTRELRTASRAMVNLLSPTGKAQFDAFYPMFEGGVASHAPDTLERLAVSCFTLAFNAGGLVKECGGLDARVALSKLLEW